MRATLLAPLALCACLDGTGPTAPPAEPAHQLPPTTVYAGPVIPPPRPSDVRACYTVQDTLWVLDAEGNVLGYVLEDICLPFPPP